jgi:hypothetical protein
MGRKATNASETRRAANAAGTQVCHHPLLKGVQANCPGAIFSILGLRGHDVNLWVMGVTLKAGQTKGWPRIIQRYSYVQNCCSFPCGKNSLHVWNSYTGPVCVVSNMSRRARRAHSCRLKDITDHSGALQLHCHSSFAHRNHMIPQLIWQPFPDLLHLLMDDCKSLEPQWQVQMAAVHHSHLKANYYECYSADAS